jgi:hypothetical protein
MNTATIIATTNALSMTFEQFIVYCARVSNPANHGCTTVMYALSLIPKVNTGR